VDASLFETFAAVERSHWWFLARREIVLGLAERTLKPGARVADVGCGTGFILEALAARYEAWGVEPSPIGRAYCRERNLSRVVAGTAGDLSALPGGGLDAVFLLDVLEHLDDDFEAVVEARRVLAPGGTLFVTVPAYSWLWSGHDIANQHRRRYTLKTLNGLLATAGFQPGLLSYYNCFLFPLAVVNRMFQRLRRAGADTQLRVPPAAVNRIFRRVFASEVRLLRDGAFPFGLSVIALAHVKGSHAK
jgi:SAM-dependent methyltransferase